MAFDFPSAPTVGQVYTSGGASYVWNGAGWTASQPFNSANYVLKAGDTMTGYLTVSMTAPRIYLDKAAGANNAAVFGRVDGKNRWAVWFGTGETESGSNAGSNFYISRYSDAGDPLGDVLNITRATGVINLLGTLNAGVINSGAQFLGGDLSLGTNRLNFAHVASTPASGPAVRWTDGTYPNTLGLYVYSGLNFQGNAGNPAFIVRSLTTDGSLGGPKVTLGSDGVIDATSKIRNTGLGVMFQERTSTHSVFHYTDASTHYLLVTNSSDPNGSWNSLRPFSFNLNSGNVDMGHNVAIGGNLNVTGSGTFGWVQVNNASSDPVRITTTSGHARYWSTVSGVRSWSFGTVNWGIFYIADESAAAERMTIGLGGNVNINVSLSVAGGITGGTVTSTGALWAHNGVLYLSAQGHYMQWSGSVYYFPHGSLNVGAGGLSMSGALSCAAITCYNINTQGYGIEMSSGAGIEGVYLIDMKHPGHAAHDYCTRIIVQNDHTINIYTAGVGIDTWLNVGGRLTCSENIKCKYSGNGYHFNWDGTLKAFIDNGDWGSVLNVHSDYRMKKDVRPLGSMWDIIKSLRPIRYTAADWEPYSQSDEIERWGLIAHELQEAMLPTAASGSKDCDGAPQQPNPMAIFATVIKALQEAMSRIEQLEQGRTVHA